MKFNNLIREYIEQIKSELDVTKIENYFRICYSKHILANDILEKLWYISKRI